jgi:hypothetical protein
MPKPTRAPVASKSKSVAFLRGFLRKVSQKMHHHDVRSCCVLQRCGRCAGRFAFASEASTEPSLLCEHHHSRKESRRPDTKGARKQAASLCEHTQVVSHFTTLWKRRPPEIWRKGCYCTDAFSELAASSIMNGDNGSEGVTANAKTSTLQEQASSKVVAAHPGTSPPRAKRGVSFRSKALDRSRSHPTTFWPSERRWATSSPVLSTPSLLSTLAHFRLQGSFGKG